MPPSTVQHHRLQSILEHLHAAEGGEDVAPAPAAASESYGFGNPRPPSSGKKGYKILTGADDGYAQHAPTVRNNELRRGVGIGTQRTRWMNRVLGEGAPGQHDAHGGYPADTRRGVVEEKEVVICGAGFGGMAAVKHLREAGITDIRVFERGAEVGGTWYWNRYPGAAVDIESTYYSYSFTDTQVRPDDGWQFSHRFSKQPELLEYAKWVSHTFDLREEMRFQTAITSAVWDHAAQRWMVTTDRGDRVTCRFVFFCNGILTDPKFSPNIRGYERFRGDSYHTSRFPRDFLSRAAGKRVGIIGTGASAVQLLPEVARVAERVCVFQRTPVYCVPRNDAPYDDTWKDRVRRDPDFLAKKKRDFHIGAQDEKMHIPEVSAKIRTRLLRRLDEVDDPVTRAELTPHYPPFCKRVAVHDDFWPQFNKPHVRLVHDPRGVSEITERGPVAKGEEWPVDMLVYATGFDSMDGAMNGIDVRGRGGRTLEQRWEAAAETMWGIHVDGFPNMFLCGGPQGASFSMQGIMVCEENTRWAARLIAHMRDRGLGAVDAKPAALREVVSANQRHADRTVWARCQTYYNDDKGNILIMTRRWDDVMSEKAALAAAGYPCFDFS